MTGDQFKIALRQIKSRAFEVQTALDVWLYRHNKRGRYRRAHPNAALRLLRIKVWSERYQLPLDECVDILITAFNEFQWGGRIHGKFGMGISINTLTSANAERILAKEIEKRYPDKGNRTIWREMMCQSQLNVERLDETGGLMPHERGPKTLLEAGSVDEYVAGYRDRVTRRREEYDRAVNQPWRRRKAYRNNPWRGV
jgi:hypothetical protein